MAAYRATQDTNLFIQTSDGSVVPLDGGGGASQVLVAWLAAGNVPDPAPPPVPSAPTSVQVNSTSTPSLSGVYAFDAVTQSKILAVSLYIQVNGKFPAGQMPFPWPDASGTMHMFTTTASFQSLASALADYATALDLGQTPTAPVTIP